MEACRLQRDIYKLYDGACNPHGKLKVMIIGSYILYKYSLRMKLYYQSTSCGYTNFNLLLWYKPVDCGIMIIIVVYFGSCQALHGYRKASWNNFRTSAVLKLRQLSYTTLLPFNTAVPSLLSRYEMREGWKGGNVKCTL